MNELKNKFNDIFLGCLLMLLLLVAYDPLSFFELDMITMSAMGFLVIVVGLFLVLIWREKPEDERVVYHKLYAGRFAYTSGIIILAVGNVVQLITHEVDIWLPITLAIMVISKLFVRIYLDLRK